MAVVIVGAGRVGLRTARILAEEGYELTLVEDDREKARRAEEEAFPVVRGDGSDGEVLEAAGVADATAIAGLTGDLSVNYAACLIGAEHGCRTVMRIDDDYREEIYEQYAEDVDEVIYPEQLGATGARTAMLGGNFNLIGDLTEELQLFTVTIPPEAPIVGARVNNLASMLDLGDARIYAHGRNREPMTIPLPGTFVEPKDTVAVIAEQEAVASVRSKLVGADS